MSDWKAEADRLRAEGLTVREIATRVGKSRSVVGHYLKPAYCACGNRRTHNRPQCRDCWRAAVGASRQRLLERVAEMYNAGLPTREIARALGRSLDGVSGADAAGRAGPEISAARKAGLITTYRLPPRIDRWLEEARGHDTPCWIWQLSLDPNGYGQTWHPRERRLVGAHRLNFENYIGAIPEDLDLDHLCRARSCVNPWHLEPVTHLENMRRSRKTHCIHGHPYDEANTYIKPSGARECRACASDRQRNKGQAA